MSGGAWGLGLFQSDYDYDIIQELSQEAGLWLLEADDAKQGKVGVYIEAIEKADRGEANAQGIRNLEHKRADETEATRKPNEIYYSIYAKLCSHPKRVKAYLENSGMLNKLIRDRLARLNAPDAKKDTFRPGYAVVLLGACAMSLGCNLPVEFFQHLRASYAHQTRVGLMRDAITQMSKALFGPNGYSNGKSYDFGSKGLDFTVNTGGPSFADRYFPSMINVPSPAGTLPQEMLAQACLAGKFDNYEVTAQYLMKKFEMSKGAESVYGADECGGCGSKVGLEGTVLVLCGRCKGRKYCGKACQKKDWLKHKVVCTALE
ncbi:hypothetical protein LTR36_003428 [Oleoguttula mirabilis]|uniref:MYND-type domain-containing protein n=1 Tax=Oleoguttula mirabilis TaxID=1507867 RepID=A0AAV9JJT6_9PEZI|nr:hypothetical protein LTR36_003428 [Oleoguttula mirabilis]